MGSKDFKKGILYGVFLSVALAVLANSVFILYRTYIKKEINYNAKARMIYSIMQKNYVEDIDKDKLYEGIYDGMVYNSTDKYSRYISKDEYQSFLIKNSGNYGGIGCIMYIDSDYRITIRAVYEGSPCEKAGIKEGDKIIKIDGTDVSYENYQDAVDMARGEKGTPVKLTVLHPDSDTPEELELTRDDVNVPTVASAMLSDNIGYIHIAAFESVTYDQYTKAYNALKAKGMDRLIIDLRNNPGGLVDSVSKVADDIIPKGVITYTEDKNGKRNYIYSDDNELDIPLVVLINSSSASASELLSACIQDTGKGTLIGETTYGKGVVQSTYNLGDGSALKITTSKYYTPNGICIDGIGVKPDIEVEADDDFYVDDVIREQASYDLSSDKQLARAVEEIQKK